MDEDRGPRLIRTSLGRAEPLLARAIAETEAEIARHRLLGERAYNYTTGRFLPVLSAVPTHEETEDVWSFGEEAWNAATAQRRALLRRLLWLRRWHELEAAQGRALRRDHYPRFGLDDFAAYIKPEELVRAYGLFEAAITRWEETFQHPELKMSHLNPRHDFDPVVCLGHWYRTMLYHCGASWRELRALARRSDRKLGLQIGRKDGKRQDAPDKQKAYRKIYGPHYLGNPDPRSYWDPNDPVTEDSLPRTPEYGRAKELWVARRHLARWGRMAMARFPKEWENIVPSVDDEEALGTSDCGGGLPNPPGEPQR